MLVQALTARHAWFTITAASRLASALIRAIVASVSDCKMSTCRTIGLKGYESPYNLLHRTQPLRSRISVSYLAMYPFTSANTPYSVSIHVFMFLHPTPHRCYGSAHPSFRSFSSFPLSLHLCQCSPKSL